MQTRALDEGFLKKTCLFRQSVDGFSELNAKGVIQMLDFSVSALIMEGNSVPDINMMVWICVALD